VLRVLFSVGILLLGPASGASLLARTAGICVETCPDDDEQGQCAPGCDDCSCCNHVRTAALKPAGILLETVDTERCLARSTPAPPPVDVRGIRHVPKAFAA
jgi:hypothetical protein